MVSKFIRASMVLVAVALVGCGPRDQVPDEDAGTGGGSAVSDAGSIGGGSDVGGGSATGGGSAAGGGNATGGGASAGGGVETGGGSASGGGSVIGGGSATGGGSAAGGGNATGGGASAGGGVGTGGGSATGGGYCPASVTESHAYPSTGGFVADSAQIAFVTANSQPCTAGNANCYPANTNPWVKRVVNLGAALGGTGTGHPNARCNDGTPAVYWVQRGVAGTGGNAAWRKRWIMYLHAGGACFDHDTCEGRWRGSHDNLMSDVDFSTGPGAGSTDGLTAGGTRFPGSANPNPEPGALKNPAFWDANHVIVGYCSSDSWSGDVGATLPTPSYVDSTNAACGTSCTASQVCCITGGTLTNPTSTCVSGSTPAQAGNACRNLVPFNDAKQLHYRGRAIVQAVLEELQSGVYDGTGDEAPGTTDPDGFDKAREFLLSGTSAGGYGVFSMIDDVNLFLHTAGTKGWSIPLLRVLGISDAGFFIANAVTENSLVSYDSRVLDGTAINLLAAATWSDDTGLNGGGRGDLDAYNFYMTSSASPFASVTDPVQKRLRARAESLKMHINARSYISTPLLIQQSQMDLNQLGWAGVTNDTIPFALPPTGEGDHGLLGDPNIASMTDANSGFTAHATANFAVTGHDATGSVICTPGTTGCFGSKQAYLNYFGRQMRERLLATDPIHWVFSRVDSWHAGFNATESGSTYNTTGIANVSTSATGGLSSTAYPNDTLYFHNGAVAKDMVRTWYFAQQCTNGLKVVGQKYLYANKWMPGPANFPSVNSAPATWNVTNQY